MTNYFRFDQVTNADPGETYTRDSLFLRHVSEDINPGLTTFDLRYRDTDHHVKSIVVGAKTNDGEVDDEHSYLLRLSDLDHDSTFGTTDWVSLRAGFMHVADPYYTAASYGKVTGRSANRVGSSLPITAIGEDQVFVLRGFSFEGVKDRNHELREIGVRYDPVDSEIKVAFVDNSPRDDEYYFEVYYFVLDAFCRPRSLNYCLVPVSDSFSFVGETARPKPEKGVGMLSGFNFRFDRGDRHLARIAVDVKSRDEIFVAFRNASGRQRVNATVDYVVWDSN